MWWAIAKAMLDKNNSPAWNRINNVMSLWNASENVGNGAKGLWNKYKPTTTNTTGE